MRINLASVLVDDQEKALRFYTDVLGFVKKTEFPVGEHRWLTVVSPEDPASDVGDACAYDRARAAEALAEGEPPTRGG